MHAQHTHNTHTHNKHTTHAHTHTNSPNTSAQVATSGANTPTVSMELANGISPCRDTLPYEGFKPTTPQKEAGIRTEPPVSLPRELSSGVNDN